MSLAFNIFKNHIAVSDNKIIKFFLKNETRYLIWLLSCSRFDDKTIKNFSFYYKNISANISSQININNQIDLAIEEGYLIKKKSDIDSRSIIVTSTDKSNEAFDIYLKNLLKTIS